MITTTFLITKKFTCIERLIVVAIIAILAPTAGWSQMLVFEENFDGTALDTDKWHKGGNSPINLDGSGIMHMVTGETNWDPYIDTRSGRFSVPGTSNLQYEIRCKTISGLQVFGFGPAAGNGEGLCFVPQPSGTDTAPYQLNIAPNSWTASVPTEGPTGDPYVVQDNTQFITYRVTLDPSTTPGSVVYEVFDDGLSDWVDVTPVGHAFAQYDKSNDWMPWVMCQGWNGGSGPGADLFVDYVRIVNLDQPTVNSADPAWLVYCD